MSALNDLKILDLSRILAGPFATQILADMGAEVWKIESAWGDDTRSWGPPFVGEESAYYLSANRGKKSIIINLRDERGQNIIKDLAIKADILVENFIAFENKSKFNGKSSINFLNEIIHINYFVDVGKIRVESPDLNQKIKISSNKS